jgi:hypothetical protein
MDLDRMHRAVRALVKGDQVPTDLSASETRAVSILRQQMDESPIAAGMRWVASGAMWTVSTERGLL